jgi:hypothetical protein
MAEDLGAFLIELGYTRSEKNLAEFLVGLFGDERRQGKLRIAQASIADAPQDAIQRTPSVLRNVPADLSPLRSSSQIAAIGEGARTARIGGTPAPRSRTPSRPVLLRQKRPAEPLKSDRVEASKGGRGGRIAKSVAPAVVGAGLVVVGFLLARPRDQPAPDPLPETQSAPVPPAAPAAAHPAMDPAPDSPVKPRPAPKKIVARGKLTLDTTPWTEVFLSNKKLGDTPIVELPMPAGRHVLKLVNEGKGIRNAIEVDIEPGKTTVKKLNL